MSVVRLGSNLPALSLTTVFENTIYYEVLARNEVMDKHLAKLVSVVTCLYTISKQNQLL